MKGVRAMRTLLELQEENISADTGGGANLSWVTLANVWAALEPLRGRETAQAENLTGALTHKIMCRAENTITPAMRFKLDDRVFNIRTVRNMNERNRLFEILAEEGVAT